METAVERKFLVRVIYNGATKPVAVESDELVSAVLQKAIQEFHIVQQPHLLSLFREDGSLVEENRTVGQDGLKPDQVLLLRPNAVKGGAQRIRVAGEILPATFKTLRECGQKKFECVAYWTGPLDDALVDGVEHPDHIRSPYGYEVSEEWLNDSWKRQARELRTIRAQVHSHPDTAFHSASDDTWPIVSQPGFISIVLPRFAVGEVTLSNAWVGRLAESGKWEQVSADEVLIFS